VYRLEILEEIEEEMDNEVSQVMEDCQEIEEDETPHISLQVIARLIPIIV